MIKRGYLNCLVSSQGGIGWRRVSELLRYIRSIRLNRADRFENLYCSISSQGGVEIVEVGESVCDVWS